MIKCEEYSQKVLAENPTSVFKSNLESLSQGGLIQTSESLADFVGNGFALMDRSTRIITKFSHNLSCRALALEVVNNYSNNCYLSCQTYEKSVKKIVSTIIVMNRCLQRTAEITKQNVESFKQRQRRKNLWKGIEFHLIKRLIFA